MNFYANLADVLARVLRGADAEETFNNVPVQVRASDGYINLSAIASAAKSNTAQYFRNKRVTRFLHDLMQAFQLCENAQLSLVMKEATNHGNNFWAHPLVVIDFAAWISPAMQIQILAWIARLLATGNVALTDPTDVTAAECLLQTQLKQMQAELTRVMAERDELALLTNKLRLRRQRPALPPGSGVYVCMTESAPDRAKIGLFDGSMNERWQSYHTHSATPVLIKAILFTSNFKLIEASLLETLLPFRRNSNDWIDLPYTRLVQLFKMQLDLQKMAGEDTAYILDETSEELIKFNSTSADLTDMDMEQVVTTITTTVNSDGTTTTTATTGLKWLDHMSVTCDCGEVFDTLRGHSIHVSKSPNSMCKHISQDILKARAHESNRKGANGARIAASGGAKTSCPVCHLEMADTQQGLANHFRLGPPACQEYGRQTLSERKKDAYEKGLAASRDKRNAKRMAELGSTLCPAGCGAQVANCPRSIGLHLRWSKDPKCIEYNERTKTQRKRATVRASNQKYMANKKRAVPSE